MKFICRRILCVVFAYVVCLSAAFCVETEFTGTGLIPGQKNGKLIVRGVFPSSPAARARLFPGQEITEVMYRGNMTPVSIDNLAQIFYFVNTFKSGMLSFKTSDGRMRKVSCAQIKLDPYSLPRSTTPQGRISLVDKFKIRSSFRPASPVCEGDFFLVMKAGKILGTAELKKLDRMGSEISVDIGKRMRSVEDMAPLRGASLILYRSSATTCHAAVQEFKKKLDKLRQQEEQYVRAAKQKKYRWFPGNTVQEINSRQRYFVFRIKHGQSLGGGGPVVNNTWTETVMYGKAVTYHIYCDGTTRFISYKNLDKGGRAYFNDLKKGGGATVFCDPKEEIREIGDKHVVVYKARMVVIK